MKKYVCTVCGYIAEGEIPAQCPVCKAPASAFVEKTGNTYVTEHVVGIGKAEGVPQEIVDGLRANFEGECSEVGMYLAMARVAEREGYPEIAEAYKRYAYEEADHASRFAELLGEVVTDSTKKNLMMRAEAECGACAGKMDLAKKAKALNLDAIHDTVHEMAKDFTGKMVLQKKSSILSKPVTQCVDYIYSNIKERITIADLAAYTGLSESYLSRVFKQNLGVSISDYIREKKIEKATHLLKYSDKPIIDIANYLSFSSQSHFIQIFEGFTGLTPKKYRDRYYKSMW